MRHKVLYTYPTSRVGMDMVREVADIKLLRRRYPPSVKITEDELIREIRDVKGLVNVRSVPVNRRVIEAAESLKIIARHGLGYDSIDVEAATDYNVLVTIAIGEGPHAVAEHAMGFMIALSRKFSLATASVKKGEWNIYEMMGVELHGKTLGIIGLGRIGATLAKMAQAFQMKIIAYDPYLTREKAREVGVELVDFTTLLKRSDYISIHVPLTEETKGLISKKEFDLMKKGVFMVNCARGGIIDEGTLYDALIDGRVAGAAIDVFEQEPPPRDSPLFKLSNVLFTPHVAGVTIESADRLAISVAEDVISVLNGRLPNIEKIVNKSLIDEPPWSSLKRAR